MRNAGVGHDMPNFWGNDFGVIASNSCEEALAMTNKFSQHTISVIVLRGGGCNGFGQHCIINQEHGWADSDISMENLSSFPKENK